MKHFKKAKSYKNKVSSAEVGSISSFVFIQAFNKPNIKKHNKKYKNKKVKKI